MANNVYGGRKMYTGGGFFIFIIPIGMIIIFFLYDFIAKTYIQYNLDKDTKEILLNVLNRDGLETEEEMREYAEKLLVDKKIDSEDFYLMYEDDKYYVTIYDRTTSIIGSLTFGKLKNKQIVVNSSYMGYYNEYKEPVVEKYTEDLDDISDDTNNNDDEDEAIIID